MKKNLKYFENELNRINKEFAESSIWKNRKSVKQ